MPALAEHHYCCPLSHQSQCIPSGFLIQPALNSRCMCVSTWPSVFKWVHTCFPSRRINTESNKVNTTFIPFTTGFYLILSRPFTFYLVHNYIKLILYKLFLRGFSSLFRQRSKPPSSICLVDSFVHRLRGLVTTHLVPNRLGRNLQIPQTLF